MLTKQAEDYQQSLRNFVGVMESDVLEGNINMLVVYPSICLSQKVSRNDMTPKHKRLYLWPLRVSFLDELYKKTSDNGHLHVVGCG